MEPSRFVRVAVEFAEGKTGWGTGYLVGPGKVLTAEHVIRGAEKIELQFEGEAKPRQARRCWPLEKADLDAAVLVFEEAQAACTAVVPLAETPLEKTTRWESRGWARAVHRVHPVHEVHAVHDELVGLKGEVFSFTAAARKIELTVEAPPREMEDWKGISGAPVFLGGRLAGIIVQAEPPFEGRRLKAVPLHLLLQAQGFREALGLGDAAAQPSPLLHVARRRLEGSLAACAAIAQVAARRNLAGWQALGSAGAVALVEQLYERTRVADVLLVLNEAHRRLSQGDLGAAAAIEAVLEHLVPLLYHRGVAHALPREPGGALVRLPVRTPTLVELAMAGRENRPARFLPAANERDFPRPLAQLPTPPEVGIDPSGAASLAAFINHLANLYFDEQDRRELSTHQAPGEKELAQRAALLDGQLRWMAEEGDDPLRLYMVFDSSFARMHAPFLEQLGRHLKALPLLELAGDDLVGERELCRPLRDLLFRAHKARENRT